MHYQSFIPHKYQSIRREKNHKPIARGIRCEEAVSKCFDRFSSDKNNRQYVVLTTVAKLAVRLRDQTYWLDTLVLFSGLFLCMPFIWRRQSIKAINKTIRWRQFAK